MLMTFLLSIVLPAATAAESVNAARMVIIMTSLFFVLLTLYVEAAIPSSVCLTEKNVVAWEGGGVGLGVGGIADGRGVGRTVGIAEGTGVGNSVGAVLGSGVGIRVGGREGFRVGRAVGWTEGLRVGLAVGCAVGLQRG